MTPAGSAGTARDGYKVTPEPGRHRAPPVPSPRAPTVIAIAAALLTAASLTAIAGTAATPDASAAARGTQVPVAASTSTAGPLEVPSIGASGAWQPSETPTENALSAPRSVPRVPVHVPAPLNVATGQPEPFTTPSQQNVTQATQPVTEEPAAELTPTAPPVLDAAAATSSATTEEQPVTESPTATTTAHPTRRRR